MKRVLGDRGTPWAAAGAVVAVLVAVEALTSAGDDPVRAYLAVVPLALLVGSAVALSGRRPGTALAVAWVSFLVWAVSLLPVLLAQLSLAVVAFSCGRRGRPGVVLAAAASSVALPSLLVLGGLLRGGPVEVVLARVLQGVSADGVGGYAAGLGVLGLVGGTLALAPLVAGLFARLLDRSRSSEQEATAAYADAESARELARWQESHAQLARDVHDVVGHSLTVVVAQAEAAQYAGDDPVVLRATLQGIADTARTSLADVRTVLAATKAPAPVGESAGAAPAALTAMVAGLRSGGIDVRVVEEGAPRPLPPELGAVAHRVTQEMLTNATRHGWADAPVHIERHWDGDTLRIDVCNRLPPEPAPHPDLDGTVPLPGDGRPGRAAAAPGSGLTGMRTRLEAVGGRLDVRRRDVEQTFTATAWVPLRPGSGPGER